MFKNIKYIICEPSGIITDKYFLLQKNALTYAFKKNNITNFYLNNDHIGSYTYDIIIKSLNYTDTKKELEHAPLSIKIFNDFNDFLTKYASEYLKPILESINILNKLQKQFNIPINITSSIFSNHHMNNLTKMINSSSVISFTDIKNLPTNNPKSIVFITANEPGIKRGAYIGCSTIGVARYSNYMNINSELEEDDTNGYTQLVKLNYSTIKLKQTCANYVICNMDLLKMRLLDLDNKIQKN
jgi:hypothetical protein